MNFKGTIGILLLLIIIPAVAYFLSTFNSKNNTRKELLSAQISKALPQPEPTQVSPKNGLKEAVEQTLSGTKGTYGIVVKNMKTGQTYLANEHRVFEPGSLYKIWVMATAFQEIKNGNLEEDEALIQDIEVLNKKFRIATDAAELTEGTIEMTVSEALTQMITISHNYAALLLSETLRNSKIREFLSSNGFSESQISNSDDPPTATPSDIALFFEKLYNKELIDQEFSEKMIKLLKQQMLNDGIPKYLPKDVAIAHKTGEIEWFKHDAGIVYSPNGDYIIVVLSESNSPLGAQERIAQISEAVYKYFNP